MRPKLSSELSAEQFNASRWLKAELLDFCEAHHLPTSGSKHDLRRRVAHFLATGEIVEDAPRRRSA